MSDQQPTSQEAWDDLYRAANAFCAAMAVWAQQAWAQLEPALRACHDVIYAKYQEAGTPYGDNPDGMLRWLREVGEVQRLRREADLIVERHEGLADFRWIAMKRLQSE